MSATSRDAALSNGKVRPIIRWGMPILHRHLKEVTPADLRSDNFTTIIRDMFATMYAAQGAGLAANQIGIDLRVFVYDFTDQGVRSRGVFCNPEVTRGGHEAATQVTIEGCLSYPGFSTSVPRPASIVVRGLDQNGEKQEVQACGRLAGILQHEIDHLNGVVYGDHVSDTLRKTMDNKYSELEESNAYPLDWPASSSNHKWIFQLEQN